MQTCRFVLSDRIRDRVSKAMSEMCRQAVPRFGTLLVPDSQIDTAGLERDPALRAQGLALAGAIA